MGTLYEDEMIARIKQKEMLQAAEQARLVRLAQQDQDKLPPLLALAYARFKLGIATLSSHTARPNTLAKKLPLENRV